MICGPLGVYVLQGPDAISTWRSLLGPTKVYRAVVSDPTSLRGRFGLTDTRNGFHGSDSAETALREIRFFFPSFDAKQII
ncbi:Nucleoside diphosphate kinase [Fasciola gigantica]|uniref:Nucleoside diphosphate kinase n=1 Tax=Fasciola gigantica TaxID=46835 RepID=A0A504Z386_FASGI|nr:Nucleoside diphosphate kinase [Fasciola gigantica]